LADDKGNNKITELRAILQRKFKTHKFINRQNQSTTENCENRNDPDLVQAFLKNDMRHIRTGPVNMGAVKVEHCCQDDMGFRKLLAMCL